MNYQHFEDFLADLQNGRFDLGSTLRGHDGLFRLCLKDGRSWYVRLLNGSVTLPASADREPDCTVITEEGVLLSLLNGTLHPIKAILGRKLSVRGNVTKLLALARLV